MHAALSVKILLYLTHTDMQSHYLPGLIHFLEVTVSDHFQPTQGGYKAEQTSSHTQNHRKQDIFNTLLSSVERVLLDRIIDLAKHSLRCSPVCPLNKKQALKPRRMFFKGEGVRV